MMGCSLFKYSPLHNVRAPTCAATQYPAVLITTGDHDNRVSPFHSLKFAATLHHAIKNNPFQTHPILLMVYKDVGHGGGKPTEKTIEENTDMLTFVAKSLNIVAIN